MIHLSIQDLGQMGNSCGLIHVVIQDVVVMFGMFVCDDLVIVMFVLECDVVIVMLML